MCLMMGGITQNKQTSSYSAPKGITPFLTDFKHRKSITINLECARNNFNNLPLTFGKGDKMLTLF